MTRPKLLLADDSVTIRKVVELTFADEGIDVIAVPDSESAMQRFVEIQPDIVLVDASLSGTNGFQICEMIKGDEATKHIPVMLLAGSFEPFDPEDAHRVGADGFMTKPFHSIRDLVGRVWTLLGRVPDSNGAEPHADVPAEVQAAEESSSPAFDDIESLYHSSFAETAEMDKLDTLETFDSTEDLLGDSGMDDEMIEASYLQTKDEPEVAGGYAQADEIRAFDWSADSIVSGANEDPGPSASIDKDSRSNECVEEDLDLLSDIGKGQPASGEEPTTLATPDVEEPAADSEPATAADMSTFETLDFSNVPSVVPVPMSIQTMNEVDADDETEVEDVPEGDDADPAIHDTMPYAVGEQPPIPKNPAAVESSVPDSVIEDIVKRVVERLSDSVVREIARVEVPRITEKLIREALEKENKG